MEPRLIEPRLIDYYNELPHGINVIDKMNEELEELQKKYDELHEKYNKLQPFPMPKIRVKSINELELYAGEIYHSVTLFKKIIYDFLNYEGWILEYDSPDRVGMSMLCYTGCGFWGTWETDNLKWGDTTAQEFYGIGNCNTAYNIYLKCKLLDQLYKLFPEYTNRKRGWFHQQIDESFKEVESFFSIILENENENIKERINKNEYHDIIYRIIMEKLFGWGGLFPDDNENSDYVQNIIYYECCQYKIHGEEFIETTVDDDGYGWYKQKEFHGYSFKCPGCGKQ